MDMNDKDRQRLFQSGILSLGAWVVIALLVALIPLIMPVPPKKEFTQVHLTLSQRPVPAQAAVPQAAVPQEAVPVMPSAPAKSTAVKPATAKTVPAKTQSTPAKTAAVKPAAVKPPAVSKGLGIPNFSTPVTSARDKSGESESLDFSSQNETKKPQSASAPPSGKTVPEFEGTAATVQKKTDSGAVVTGKNSTAPAGNTAPSAETAKSLAQITGQAKAGSQGKTGSTGQPEGSASAPSAASASSALTSKVSGLTFEGAPRKLISPSVPSIVLPANLAALVNSDRNLTVQFTVRPDGTVPGGLITFTPSAILPAAIRDYLKAEFSRWIFEKSTQDGQARFQYSIRVQ